MSGHTLSIFRTIREAIEKGPWMRPPVFHDEAPRGCRFSTTFNGVTGYITVEGRLYKVTITPEDL